MGVACRTGSSKSQMNLNISLERVWLRIAVAAVTLAVCGVLVFVITSQFVVGTLTDERLAVNREMLVVPAQYFPNSPRLNGRLAQAEMFESDRDLASAARHAQRAVDLSPNDFHFRLILASVREAEGDRAAAEQALYEARRLAPNNSDVRWRLANLLVREGKLAASLEEFKIALAANPSLLPATLDLVWRTSRGSYQAVDTVTPQNSKCRIALAGFLIKEKKYDDAAVVFGGVDRTERLAAPESGAVLSGLISAGSLDTARGLWASLVGSGEKAALVWNGGFESDILKNFNQFDWILAASDYVRLALDPGIAHSGSRSLKLSFTGLDTTRLDNEVKQLVLVTPGKKYRLEVFVKSENLVTPEGPRVVVTDTGNNWIASSEPVASGSTNWTKIALEFIAPPRPPVAGAASPAAAGSSSVAVYVSIKRKPKFSYDDPTKGAVWFDDFVLIEL
jgi:tetratricopeptide (TPR) repeat protein